MTVSSLSLRFMILQEKRDNKIGNVSFVLSLSSFAIFFIIFYSLLNVIHIRDIFVVSVCLGLFSYLFVCSNLIIFSSSHFRVCLLARFGYFNVMYSHNFHFFIFSFSYFLIFLFLCVLR